MINPVSFNIFNARIAQWKLTSTVQVTYYEKERVASVYVNGTFRNTCQMQRIDFENFFAKVADEVVRSYDCDRVFFN